MSSSDKKFQEDILSDYRKRITIAMKGLVEIRDREIGKLPTAAKIAEKTIKEMQEVTENRSQNLDGYIERGSAKPSNSHGHAKDAHGYLLGGTLGSI